MTDYPAIDQLVPHRAPMLLIDRILDEVDGVTRAQYTVTADNPLLVEGQGLPTYAAFEIMAQAICATDGLRRWRAGKPPELGFLLGCRRYAAARPWIAVGEALVVESRCLLDGETSSYECRVVDSDGAEVSTAQVNVFQPADVAAYLKGSQ